MPAARSFDYAIVRVVPQVERGEFFNVGVILFCRPLRFLAARMRSCDERVRALAPGLDMAALQSQLDLIPRLCVGGDDAGPIGRLSQAERFHWLVAPRSTIVQISPVHCGLCTDPQEALDSLFEKLVV
jgi:hypothetical protein